MSRDVHVLLVEDHVLLRSVIRAYLESKSGFASISEAGTPEEALALLNGNLPDIVIVDTALKRASGIDLVAEIAQLWPNLPCLMLSGHAEKSYIIRALDAGARGYVLKDRPRELPSAIVAVIGGDRYVSSGHGVDVDLED